MVKCLCNLKLGGINMFVAYFCCAASGTSQEYAKMVKKQMGSDERVCVDYIKNVAKKFESGELERDYDVVLAHGRGISVNESFFTHNKFKEMVNTVYLMPQVGGNLFAFKQCLDPWNIPCKLLTPKECTDVLLNLNNAETVFKDIFDAYKEIKSSR